MGWKLAFEVKLESDYHVGAGFGLGPSVDSALLRDADGVPVLRGTMLSGLLRDGLAELLELVPLRQQGLKCRASGLPPLDKHGKETPRFCGQRDPAQDDCPVCRVFGSPRTAKCWRFSSARPTGVEAPLQRPWKRGQHAAQAVPHVRISPRTRRPEAGKLFSREEGDARLTFEFCVSRQGSDAQALKDAAWIVAAARMVRRLGASRRRGRGACAIHLVSATGHGLPALAAGKETEDWFLEQFRTLCLRDENHALPAVSVSPFVRSTNTKAGPLRMRLVARFDEPLVVSERGEAGNEFRAADELPGPTLRGALASLVAVRGNLEQRSGAEYEAFVRLFFHGGVRVPFLFPAHRVDHSIVPAIPAPLDLLGCELYHDHGLRALSLVTEPDCLEPVCAVCQRQGHNVELKPLGCWLTVRPGLDRVQPSRVTEMHPTIDRATQRAASGQLFGLDALAGGQYFCGEMVCATEADWEDLCTLCGWNAKTEQQFQELRFGKAHRRGYGKALLWVQRLEGPEVHPWCPLPLASRVTDAHQPLVLTLLTDTIALDPWGRYRLSLDPEWLSTELGVRVTRVPNTRSFCASKAVDSFHAYLGLPRWRDVALRAGSAVALQVEEDLPLEKLQQRLETAEKRGLGLRRHEGFGCFALNHPVYDSCKQVRAGSYALPKDMRLSSAAGIFRSEADFQRVWNDALARQDWRPFGHTEFESLSRLLRTRLPANQQEVRNLVEAMGHPRGIVDEATIAELTVRLGEKAPSYFLRQEKARAGLQALDDLLIHLTDAAGSSQRCWQMGLEMLAGRIAAEARKEEKA